MADQAAGDVTFWYDQLAKATAARYGPKAAFEAYRKLLDGSGVDPYREPMFDRVWCGARDGGVVFGLQFRDIELEGWLSLDAEPWPPARETVLAEVADKIFDLAERKRNPYFGFAEFVERCAREMAELGDAAQRAQFELSDWQRQFAEQVEAGNVQVGAIGGRRERKQWVATMMRRFEQEHGMGLPSARPPVSECELRRPDGTVLARWLGEPDTFTFTDQPQGPLELWRDGKKIRANARAGGSGPWEWHDVGTEGGWPPTLDGLQRMIDSVHSTGPDLLDYIVLDPAVPPGKHIDGRDALGKRYVRVPAAALDGVMGPPRIDGGGQLGAVWGFDVYRREDLPITWPA